MFGYYWFPFMPRDATILWKIIREIDFLTGWLLHVRRNLDARHTYSHDHNRKGCYFRPIRRRRRGGMASRRPATLIVSQCVARRHSYMHPRPRAPISFLYLTLNVRVARVMCVAEEFWSFFAWMLTTTYKRAAQKT